jgi:hypothetical protein
MDVTETRSRFAPLGDAMRDIRAAEDELRAEQDAALRRYVERVDAILAFRLELPDTPEDEDHDPSHVLDALRSRLGELRVQARLGAMDGEEVVERVRAALRRIAS